MGLCLCRDTAQVDTDTVSAPSAARMGSDNIETVEAKCSRVMDAESIRHLIVDMIRYVGSYQENASDAPTPLLQISRMAETDEGWCLVMSGILRYVSLDEPLGPSTITIVFDDCPLPARETVIRLIRSLHLSEARSRQTYESDDTICFERNVMVLLGCIAEKFAGTHCIEILTDDVLNYLETFLLDEREPNLVLFALVALEQFARTAECKVQIEQSFASKPVHPLLPLERHHEDPVSLWRQVGFCAKWLLDNTFLFQGRRLSFETINMEPINALLNTQDVSEYLKISPDGQEARCDAHTFESVRATFQIDSNCWYYEAELVTAGVMQIGWATKDSEFQNHDGFGVGDDLFSLAYDGCRRLIWHQTVLRPATDVPTWKPGDILGCLIDVDRKQAIFELNGYRLLVCTDIFRSSRLNGVEVSSERCREGFFPAASFMAHQHCRFNFGAREFSYKPRDREIQIMNEHGVLTPEEKKIIPRRILLQQICLQEDEIERRCVVCLDDVGSYGLEPCRHGAFCHKCVELLASCPLCRRYVKQPFVLPL